MNIQKIDYSRNFRKKLALLPAKKRIQALDAIALFEVNQNTRKLRLHQLKGSLAGIYSISAGGDLRLHFEFIVIDNVALFIDIGTHSQLYK